MSNVRNYTKLVYHAVYQRRKSTESCHHRTLSEDCSGQSWQKEIPPVGRYWQSAYGERKVIRGYDDNILKTEEKSVLFAMRLQSYEVSDKSKPL